MMTDPDPGTECAGCATTEAHWWTYGSNVWLCDLCSETWLDSMERIVKEMVND